MSDSSNDENTLLTLFSPLEPFTKALLDAYVIVDEKTKVVKCNLLFSQLVGQSSKAILKVTSIDDLIRFYLDNKSISIKDLLLTKHPSRMDEIVGITEKNSDLSLILGLYPFYDKNICKGIFLLIRDVTAETNLQGKYTFKAAQSITDKLTGLYNRGYFDTVLPEVITQTFQARRVSDTEDHQAVSLIMADIDFFKKINDNYGHQTGDLVLENVSRVLKSKLRKSDIACRYGGEEFVIILPNTDINSAYTVAEKIRASVEETKMFVNKQDINVTISMGVAQLLSPKETPENLLERADHVLYYSKKTGRNKITLSDADGKPLEELPPAA